MKGKGVYNTEYKGLMGGIKQHAKNEINDY